MINPGLLYLSGPMTGYRDFNAPGFNYVASEIRARGFYVVNPAELGEIAEGIWTDYLKRDLRIILECSGLVLLPGHKASKGAKLERLVAETLGYPVWTLNAFLRPQQGFADPRAIVNKYLELAVIDGPTSAQHYLEEHANASAQGV